MDNCRQTFNHIGAKYLFILFISILLFAGCKKEKTNAPQGNGPATKLNGWSYLGKANLLPYSEDNLYNLYLAKVHEHSSGYYDIFYGVKYKMPNYYGPGNGFFINSTRWTLKTDGTTLRNVENSPEFITQTTGMLYEPLYSLSGGSAYVVGYNHPVDVIVYGTGQSEFKVYNPGAFFSNKNAGGSPAPLSVVSSPACHLKAIDRKVLTQNYWGSFNLAMGTHTSTQQSFVLSVDVDSQMVIVNAVTPQDIYSPDYGTIRGVQPMLGKKITEIIPQWNTAYQIEELPYYYQFGNMLYLLLQNKQQLFLVKFNLNTFQFQLVQQYSQPRSVVQFERDIHHFHWIDTDEGTFLFTEKRKDKLYALLHKNGTTKQIELPQFITTVVPAIADIRYENGKYWMIVAENDKSLHLFNKNY